MLPEIAEATAFAHPGVNGNSILVAYVVPRAGQSIVVDAIRAKLGATLPRVMLPVAIVPLNCFPYLANGKVDRRALPAPVLPTGLRRNGGKPTAWERRLRVLWRSILRLNSYPDGDDTFVALGGHSLDALRTAEVLRRRFGVNLPPSTLLGETPFSDLARDLSHSSRDACAAAGHGADLPPSVYPLSGLQRRFWFLEQAYPEAAGNRVLAAITFAGRGNRAALEDALEHVVARHELLRSRVVDNGCARVVDAPTKVGIEWTEDASPGVPLTLADLPAAAAAPFDLSATWPVRAYGLAAERADILVLVFHHVAVDAWSVEVLLDEIDTVYEAFRVGDPPPHLPDAVSFASTISRLERRLDATLEATQLAFWRAELSGAPQIIQLPSDRPRPQTPSFNALRYSDALPPRLTQALDTFCLARSATRASVMLSAFALLVARYAREDEVIVGVPVTQRLLPDEAAVVGPLLNTVPVRCSACGSNTFAAHAAALGSRLAVALDHADVSFERIVEMLSPPRDASRHPVYQIMFSYHHAASRRARSATALATFAGTVSCDLALTVTEVGSELHVDLDVARGVVHPSMAKRMLEQLTHLLYEQLVGPGVLLDRVQLLPPQHRIELLSTLNRSPALEEGGPASLSEAFEQQAARTPAAAAVIANGVTVSYGELATRSAAIAAELASRGVNSGDFVPVFVTVEANFVSALLAVLRRGAAFVPLDPAWPDEMVRTALAETRATVVVGPAPAVAGESGVFAISNTTRAPSYVESVPRTPDSPMYAIYTSGTTGRPKAAIVPDRGIVNRFRWMSSVLGAEPITLQTTSAVYDSAVWQLLWPLFTGGTAVIPEKHSILDADRLTELVTRHHVNVLDFVPSVLLALLPELERRTELRDRLQGVRWIILGGEALRPGLAARVRRLLPLARIFNLYGPTEASIGCISYEIVDEPHHRVPIGRPIPNVQAILLDQRGELTPRGAIGELWLLGDSVGLGYLGGQDQGGFRRAPLPELNAVRAFRTGDLARWNERGYLEFHGRGDRQLKIRGVRIEPVGIESVLERHEAVRQASVVVRANPAIGHDALIAYVEFIPERKQEAEGLLRWLRAFLPASAMPDRIELVDEIPRAASGKLDESRLPPPAPALRQLPGPSSVFARVARAWTVVLSPDVEVDADANFFDVGGHSLLLISLRRELEAEFVRSISIVDLFRHPTLRAQAEMLEPFPR
jgi:amino acid adenylation domain-containing protein